MMEDRSRRREKLQKVFMVVFTAALAVVVAVCSASFGNERRVPIYGVDTDEKKVAISFDAAWGNEFTSGILDILDTYNVKATFFLVDFWSQEYPEDVKEIAARGHDIGNHSTTHPDMAGMSEEQIAEELNTSADTIESLTGARPTLFRPPYGSYSDTLIETAESLGYQTIQWSVDTCAAGEKEKSAAPVRAKRAVSPRGCALTRAGLSDVPVDTKPGGAGRRIEEKDVFSGPSARSGRPASGPERAQRGFFQ